MTKKEIKDFINNYAKTHHISKKTYSLFPLYLHLDGFSHSIGFTNHAPKKDVIEHNYNSVGYSNNMSEYEERCWGYINNYQEEIATAILSKIPHSIYQNNAKEILF